MNTLHRLLIALIVALIAPAALAQTDQLQAGLDLLNRAAAVREDQPDLARKLASDAAALIDRSMSDQQSASPLAQRALGNAHLIAGDHGHAVLAFRRALDADPTDRMAAASLEHARAEIDVAAPPSNAQAWSAATASVRAALPRRAFFLVAIAGFAGACLAFAAAIQLAPSTKPRSACKAAGIALFSLAFLPAAALIADTRAAHHNDHAAVVIASTAAHSGPDDAVYPPVFETPVQPGTEVTIKETRPGWTLVAIGSAQGWLPDERLEPVRPDRTAKNE